MSDSKIDRREFVRTTAAGLAASIPAVPATASALGAPRSPRAPEVLVRSAVKPLVIADASGIQFKNRRTERAGERAMRPVDRGVTG